MLYIHLFRLHETNGAWNWLGTYCELIQLIYWDSIRGSVTFHINYLKINNIFFLVDSLTSVNIYCIKCEVSEVTFVWSAFLAVSQSWTTVRSYRARESPPGKVSVWFTVTVNCLERSLEEQVPGPRFYYLLFLLL